MNPYLPLAALVALILVGAGGFFYGGHVREAEMVAKQAKADEIRRNTIADAREGAAQAIAAIDIKQVTIRQRVETEVRENVVYRECVNSDAGLRLINEALTGKAQPVGGSELPGTPASDR